MTAGTSLTAGERCDGRIARIPGRSAAIEEVETDASCGNARRRDHCHDDRPLQSPLPVFSVPACFRAIDVRRSAGRFREPFLFPELRLERATILRITN